jgi:hypothetical protein
MMVWLHDAPDTVQVEPNPALIGLNLYHLPTYKHSHIARIFKLLRRIYDCVNICSPLYIT